MTLRRAPLCALLLISPLAVGCVSDQHRPAPPAQKTAPAPAPRPRPRPSCAPGTECAPKGVSPFRQYYDVRHRRYYYFDPAKGAYFWEDGQPKR